MFISATPDSINPAHYNQGGIEVFDFIDAYNLDLYVGTAVKYLARAGKKDPAKEIEDIKKAMRYLDRRLENLEKNK